MPEENMEATESAAVDSPELPITAPPGTSGYTITGDGEQQQVSLEELQSGYQRQADYTRKTQELASERERLQQAEAIVAALESDPTGTMQALGDAFGVQAAPAPRQQPTDPYGGDNSIQRSTLLEHLH